MPSLLDLPSEQKNPFPSRFRHYAQISTDRNGYAEIRLLRGMTVDVSIDGTGFVRRIQIPTVGIW